MGCNTFFIGDTHFGHNKIATLRGFSRVEEHNEEMIKRWNSVVRKKDIVWLLGDYCFGKANMELGFRLNGQKHLVMGNHDQYQTKDYLLIFDKLHGAVQHRDYILTHIPVHDDQFNRYKGNIHGHLHQHVLSDTRYINVSAEQINLTPISWEGLNAKAAKN